MKVKFIFISIIFMFLFPNSYATENYNDLPSVNQEFRGSWIATVHNIDWPSAKGLNIEQQKSEAINILNTLKELKVNAVIFQVRPQADAFYKSNLEPWSEFITGVQGEDPGYDPLSFWIDEAHKRGIELHAWFNPYRANADSKNLPDIPDNTVVAIEGGYYWFIPTDNQVRTHTLNVIMDVVNRYDIDGVHMDDYFYPYPENWPEEGFPDQEFFKEYKGNGGKLNIYAWRRQAVNTLIKDLQAEIKKAKPYVKFGISPFGIWRPGYPEGIKAGVDSFKELAADSRKWIRQGWVDYLAPQLYWPIDQAPQSYEALLDWWIQQNFKNHHIWPGLYTTREAEKGTIGTDEIINQINMARDKIAKNKSGHFHFSNQILMNNTNNIKDILAKEVYQDAALTPSYSNIASTPISPEIAQISDNNLLIDIPKLSQNLIIYAKTNDGDWISNYHPAYNQTKYKLAIDKNTKKIVAIIMDRYGNLSEPSFFEVKQK